MHWAVWQFLCSSLGSKVSSSAKEQTWVWRPWPLVLRLLVAVPDSLARSTLKMVHLKALSSLKRVGDLQALSISPSCMGFAPGLVKVLLLPRPDYAPKVASNPFRFQQVVLEALSHADAGSGSIGLCPVRAIRIYVDRTAQWRGSDQLFMCFDGKSKGFTVTKQWMSHWIVEAISLAYAWLDFTSRITCSLYESSSFFSGLSDRVIDGRGLCCSWMVLS